MRGDFDGYRRLADAIILRAVDDLRKDYFKMKKNPENIELKASVKSLSDFFKSGYFCMLTTIDGSFLLARLKRDIDRKFI